MTGATIEMRLMKRERSSLLAVPVAHAGLAGYARLSDAALDRSLSKLILAGAAEVIVIVFVLLFLLLFFCYCF